MSTQRSRLGLASAAGALLCALSGLTSPGLARTWVVSHSGFGDFKHIQEAILASTHGDVIEVHSGVYREHLYFGGRRIVVRSVEGPGKTIVDGGGIGSVVTMNLFESRQTVLEGFTLRNGRGTHITAPLSGGGEESAQQTYGGGLILFPASPTLRNLVVEDNLTNIGGGLYCMGGVPQIENCIFRGNLAGSGAGVALEYNAGAQFEHCHFMENYAALGGGAWIISSAPEFHLCHFEGNTAGEGGALYVRSGGQGAQLHHSTFWKNQAGEGSIALVREGALLIRSCVAVANGFEIKDKDPAVFSFRDGSSGEIKQTIFSQNTSLDPLLCSDSEVSFFCNDFWPEPVPLDACSPGAGNFSLDPLFCDVEAGDFRLKPDSPCLPEHSPEGCGAIGPSGEPDCPSAVHGQQDPQVDRTPADGD